jgi:hypothetical protein
MNAKELREAKRQFDVTLSRAISDHLRDFEVRTGFQITNVRVDLNVIDRVGGERQIVLGRVTSDLSL